MATPGQPPPQGIVGAATSAVQQQQPQQPQQQPGGQSLPATGLQQQLSSINQFYQKAQQGPFGVSAQSVQGPQTQLQGPSGSAGGAPPQGGQVNIQQLAKNLAGRYGLELGRGELVDPSGNFLMTPEQLSSASGGQLTQGMASAKMNYISQAVANQQNQQQQSLGRAALSTGLGLVQSRGRGSAAAMQSGFYEGLADLYANEEYEATDFSFFIEEERFRMAQEMERKRAKAAKKGALGGSLGSMLGLGVGMFFGGPAGASAGASIGGGVGEMMGGWF